MLTGKANEAFLNHSIGKDISLFETMLPIYKHALIIEWLDSVGYITHTHFDIETKLWGYEVFNNKLYDKLGESTLYDENIDVCIVEMAVYQCRKQATEEAIIKANEIYNGN